jgi:hypothetical protein
MISNYQLFFEQQDVKFNSKDFLNHIRIFEEKTKYILPKDFKDYIKSIGNSYDNLSKKLLNKKVKLPNNIDDGIYELSKYILYNHKNITFWDALDWEGKPKEAIIFAIGAGGNAYAFYKNNIYYFNHDPLKIIKIANDFKSFLKLIK